MGASEALTDPSTLYDVGNAEFSDTYTMLTFRNALASVQNGESDLYDELVQSMQISKGSDHAVWAVLVIAIND